MSKESAKEFTEKFYNDDDFLMEFCKKGGLNKDASDEEKSELLMKVSKEMGYDFTDEEYTKSLEEYFKGKGVMFAIKAFRRINKIAKKAEKEKKKSN